MAEQRASGYEKEGPRRPTVSCALAPIEPPAVASNKRSSCELTRRRRSAATHDSTTRNRSCLLQTTGYVSTMSRSILSTMFPALRGSWAVSARMPLIKGREIVTCPAKEVSSNIL